MKDRVFVVREGGQETWRAEVEGRLINADFNSRGAALAAIPVERRRRMRHGILPIMAQQCATCPFREGSKYAALAGQLGEHALTKDSRICHSTGTNAIGGRTGKPSRLCRGARDLQLKYFYSIGFISAPTDEAWAAKCQEMGLK